MSRYLVSATWDDAPHLTPERKESLWGSIPAYQRDARTRGIPQLGKGVIYPFPEDTITVDDFAIPADWPCAYGLDVGGRTAAVWGAKDPKTGIRYLWSVHYQEGESPAVHAEAIRGRGKMPGTIDPASRQRSQTDGARLLTLYGEQGLVLRPATNAVESGIYVAYMGLQGGTIKVFRSLLPFFAEYRVYRRNEKGQIVKEKDHIMDAFRYLLVDGTEWWLPIERTIPVGTFGSGVRPGILSGEIDEDGSDGGAQAWMQ